MIKEKTLIFHKKFLPLIIIRIPIIKEAQSNDKLQNENAYTDENFCYDQPPLGNPLVYGLIRARLQ